MRKLAIAMPLEGPPDTARCYYKPQELLQRIRNVEFLTSSDGKWGGVWTGNVDVVRARDRIARNFLQSDCTDLLWWDEDVCPDDPSVIKRLLETGFDVVGCPYRRKRNIEEYPYRTAGPEEGQQAVQIDRGCVRVDALAFGFMLTSRRVLEAMWSFYEADRWYWDVDSSGVGSRTVSLFDLQYTEPTTIPDSLADKHGIERGQSFRTKLSEDYSFCQSLKPLSIPVMMYVGPGSPVSHLGNTAFRPVTGPIRFQR